MSQSSLKVTVPEPATLSACEGEGNVFWGWEGERGGGGYSSFEPHCDLPFSHLAGIS
jgi:hypothetical protein